MLRGLKAGWTWLRGLSRPRLLSLFFTLGFGLIGGRLVILGLLASSIGGTGSLNDLSQAVHRPDVVDRQGRILATDIKSASLYADPKRVIDVDDLIEQVTSVLPDVNGKRLRHNLKKSKRFVWIKRELSPKQQAEIHELGLPGIGQVDEYRRVYPAGATTSHVVGHVDIDNRGLAGIEKFIDDNPQLTLGQDSREGEPQIRLSIDLGAQHGLREELALAVKTHRAKAGAGIVMDVKTGEVVAMTSLPDYDPNKRGDSLDKERYNRVTAGVFELGSVFKVFTTAAALDNGVVTLKDGYDATVPIKVGRFSIDDFHPQRRWLSVPEIFTYSSNIGTAKMALDLGIERQQAFLRRMGFLGRIRWELGETAAPIVPNPWSRVTSMTVAYGHGISVTPLQLVAATAGLVNGGHAVQPTLLPPADAGKVARGPRIARKQTSDIMRGLMRLNAVKGTAKKADAVGYRVGGKTGTAEKVVHGRYSQGALLTSFLGVFPSEAPRYVIAVILDEPQRSAATMGYATAGWNAAPTTAKVVERIAPLLGVSPRLEPHPAFDDRLLASY